METSRFPDAILLQVILLSDIPTIKSLRLTSKYVNDLITTYQRTIHHEALRRTYSEYEIAPFRPIGDFSPSIEAMMKLFNRHESAKWLSGVLLEKHCDHIVDCVSPETKACNVSAHDPRGDTLRARLAVGWSVLWHLADIAHVVEAKIRAKDPNTDAMEIERQAREKG